MDAIEALKSRRSVRAYTAKPVAREILEELVDCARLAPSGMNVQPCDFVVITDAETRERIAEICEYGPFIAEAPACIMLVCREEGLFLEDAACAALSVMVAARAHELGTCWVHAFGKDCEHELGATAGVPKDHRVVCVLAVGYGDFPPPPPKRELSEVLHWDRFVE
ncbi:MAG: nitroreductase family protein [Armatimonadetes bacterium]|nr:nitroreductase family protein [Armatimonadota bacterium]